MRFLIASLIPVALLLVGCGPTCQSTCSRLYDEGGGSCHIQRPGHKDQVELKNRCMEECETALMIPGDKGDYDPYTNSGGSASVEIENEMQAASWMNCISETSCDRLEQNYCAPVW